MSARFRIRTSGGQELSFASHAVFAEFVRSGDLSPDDVVYDAETRESEPVVAVSQEGRRLVDVAREAAMAAERTAIAAALKQVRWNRRKAAQLLDVSYKTLLNKIKQTGLEQP